MNDDFHFDDGNEGENVDEERRREIRIMIFMMITMEQLAEYYDMMMVTMIMKCVCVCVCMGGIEGVMKKG